MRRAADPADRGRDKDLLVQSRPCLEFKASADLPGIKLQRHNRYKKQGWGIRRLALGRLKISPSGDSGVREESPIEAVPVALLTSSRSRDKTDDERSGLEAVGSNSSD